MNIHSINNWMPDAEVLDVRAGGGFIIVSYHSLAADVITLDEVYLNSDGREVLRVSHPVPELPTGFWALMGTDLTIRQAFSSWWNHRFPRRSSEEIAKLEAEFRA